MLFQSWRKTVIFICALVFVFILLSWTNLLFNQQPFIVFIENGVRELLAPLQRLLERSFVSIQEGIAAVQELGTLRLDNQRLREENEELRKTALLLQETQEALRRFQEMLDYKSHNEDYVILTARIIGWPSNWSSRFTLNTGERDGVFTDMGVITPRGVVGRIIRSTASTSELMLLQDELSGIGGRVLSSSALGIVRGMGRLNPQLKMINISLEAEVKLGDSVVTSGLGDSFPSGILIGTVTAVEVDVSGLHQTATLQMAVDPYRLYEVMIIVDQVTPDAEESALEDSAAP